LPIARPATFSAAAAAVVILIFSRKPQCPESVSRHILIIINLPYR
jgi:hypothetical protein